jgi:hypothetical protein
MNQLLTGYIKQFQGFSLIEMSVVLASIAAVISVTAGGVAMINKARLGDVVSEVAKFAKAAEAFEKQYGAIPGDIANVSTISGATAGNGNGAIDTASESLQFWRDLSLTNLIKGNYDGSSTFVPGTGVPASSVKNGGYNVLNPTSVSGAPAQAIIIELAGFSSVSNALAILTPEDARSIDVRADDGNPNTGTIRATGSGTGGNCISGSAYNLSNSTVSCQLRFIINANSAKGDAAAVTGTCTVLGSTRETADNTVTCPIGFVGKAIETCRITSANVGAWEATGKYCDIVTCGLSKYGDTRTLNCINGMTGGGISQTCSENGIWKTTATSCTADLTATCTNGASRAAQACDWGQTGRILYSICASGIWGVVSNTNCAAITCSGVTIGDSRTYAAGCGANYTGTAKEVCTLPGTWVPTSVGASCSPIYTGACTSGSTADRDIGCPPGKTGSHIQTCIDNGASDYWVTKTDSCLPITCDGGENVGSTRVREGDTCTFGRQGTVLEACTSDGGSPAKGVWVANYSNCTAACDGSLDTLGNVTWPSTAAGVTANGTCVTNYSSVGTPTRACNADGTWSSTVTNACTRYQCAAGTTNNAVWPLTDSSTTGVAGACTWPTYQGKPKKDCSALGVWGSETTPCTPVTLPKTSNLTLWLDPDDPTTLFTDSACLIAAGANDPVGCWKDKSGLANNVTQSTSNARPALLRNRSGGRPALSFNGSSSVLASASLPGSTFFSASQVSIFVVDKMTSSLSSRSLLGFEATSSANRLWVVNNPAANGYRFDYPNDSPGSLTGTTNISSAWNVGSLIKSSTNQYVYTNGSLEGSQANALSLTTATSAQLFVGSGGATTPFNYYTGEIGEILIYNTAVTYTEQIKIQVYLGDKWGIQMALPVSGATFWLDASDSSTMFTAAACTGAAVDSSLVMCWKDKSTNLKHATNAVADTTRPTYKTAIQNNRNVIRFDGSNDYLATASTVGSTFFGTNESSVFLALKPNDTATSQEVLYWESGAGNRATLYFNSLEKLNMDYPNNGAGDIAGIKTNTSSWIVASAIKTTTNHYIYINGALDNQQASALSLDNTASAVLNVGVYSSSFYFNGDMGEIIIYNTGLSGASRKNIETFLSEKWGINSVQPSTIPAPNPTFWLDASDSSTMFTAADCTGAAVNNSLIMCWQDKSTNLKHATNAVADTTRPAYITAAQNNLNVVRFDGSNDKLATASTAGSVFFNANEMTAFMVNKQTSTANIRVLATWDAPDASNRFELSRQVGLPVDFYFPSASIRGTTTTSGVWSVNSFLKTTTNMYIYLNGSIEGAKANALSLNTAASASMYVGIWNNGTSFSFLGDIGEFLIYRTALSVSDRQLTQSYLGDKWGIAVQEALPLPPTGTAPSLWLDATYSASLFSSSNCKNGATPASGSIIGCWKDISGNGNNLIQANAVFQPTYTTSAGLNGQNVISFVKASTTYMATSSNFVFDNSNSDATIFMAFTDTNFNEIASLYNWATNGGARVGGFTADTVANGGITTYFYTTTTAWKSSTSSASTWAVSTPYIYSTTFYNGDMKQWQNGTIKAAASPTGDMASVSAPFLIGYNTGNSTWYLNSKVGEILVYNTGLDSSSRALVDSYLGTKYAVTINAKPSTAVATPTFWLDASDATTMFTAANCTGAAVDASLVMCWKDKSTNLKHATNAVADTTRPTYKTSIQNGKNVVRFDGSNDYLATASTLGSTFVAANEFSAFVASKPSDTATFQEIFFWESVAANRYSMFFNATEQVGMNFPNAGGGYLGGTISNTGVWTVGAAIKTTTNQYIYTNGSLDATQANAVALDTTGSSVMNIGVYTASTYFFNGDMGEIILYNRGLTDLERVSNEEYLSNKWGIVIH